MTERLKGTEMLIPNHPWRNYFPSEHILLPRYFPEAQFESLVLWFHSPCSTSVTLNTHQPFSDVHHNIPTTLTPHWKYILPLLLCPHFSNFCSEINLLLLNVIDVFASVLLISLQSLNILTFPESYKLGLPVLKNQRCDPSNKSVNMILICLL